MNATDVKGLLREAGFPENSIDYALAQACFESGSLLFDSVVAIQNNNLTGIIFANATYQHNAIQGIPKPANEQAGHYAHFATLLDWAIDFKRIVHAQFPIWNTEGRPIDANDMETYVRRLKLNHYFEGDEADYLAGLTRYHNELFA